MMIHHDNTIHPSAQSGNNLQQQVNWKWKYNKTQLIMLLTNASEQGLCTVVIKPWSQTLYIICESAYLYFD